MLFTPTTPPSHMWRQSLVYLPWVTIGLILKNCINVFVKPENAILKLHPAVHFTPWLSTYDVLTQSRDFLYKIEFMGIEIFERRRLMINSAISFTQNRISAISWEQNYIETGTKKDLCRIWQYTYIGSPTCITTSIHTCEQLPYSFTAQWLERRTGINEGFFPPAQLRLLLLDSAMSHYTMLTQALHSLFTSSLQLFCSSTNALSIITTAILSKLQISHIGSHVTIVHCVIPIFWNS